MARIGLVGFYGWGNYGDELFLELWKDRVGRFHDVSPVNDLQAEPYFSRPATTVAAGYDAFLIGGGDLVIPNKISPLYWNAAWLTRPVYIAGVGVPTWVKHEHPDVLKRMREFFQHPNVRYVSARDDESAAWISDRLAPKVPVRVHADLVFALPLPPPAVFPRPAVGVVVRHQRSGGSDMAVLRDTLLAEQARGATVVRIVLATGPVAERDQEVADRLDIPGSLLVRSESLDELTSALGGLDCLLSQKFHGTVVATAYGVPTVVLSSTSKSRHLYRRTDRLPLLSSMTDPQMSAKVALSTLRVPAIVRDTLRREASAGVEEVVERLTWEVSPAG